MCEKEKSITQNLILFLKRGTGNGVRDMYARPLAKILRVMVFLLTIKGIQINGQHCIAATLKC